ncbi:hypothetical protein MMC16_006791 [Acarospora aff. strigata]|nr:hypothetical protein [Acarospora aff. strigata]
MVDTSGVRASLIEDVKNYVKDYMSHFDASHDYQHIVRVLALAQHIEREETMASTRVPYDRAVIILAALLHDVGDTKYVQPGGRLAEQVLLDLGADEAVAEYVQTIVENVSYSAEVKSPNKVISVLRTHPELAAVQDADRLDALGAVGIGRTFTFGGAKRREGGMEDTIGHFTAKLEKLEKMMKTDTGKKLAVERTERLRVFRGWWEEECAVVGDELN